MKDPKSIRIVFMGTPGFAVGVLEKLVAQNYQVVAVVTAADKPAGRGRQLQESEVKQYAVSKGIPVLQPEKLKSPEFISELQSFAADLQIVVAFRMLPEQVWNMPPIGTFNLHASLLPQYRGAAPINRAIMNGETKTGVTTFFLRHEIDTGSVLLREEVTIDENETAGELHDRLMHTGASLVVQTVDLIASENYTALEQSSLISAGEKLNEAPKIFRDDCRINWEWNGKKIHDFIRGLSPYPGAWTLVRFADNRETPVETKIFKTRFVNEVRENQFPALAVNGGTIYVEEIQIPGKKRMSVQEFCNGKNTENLVFE
jgi:methionyl-tRNA formyltransferase